MADIYVLPEVVDEPMNGCAKRGLRRDFEQPSNEGRSGEAMWPVLRDQLARMVQDIYKGRLQRGCIGY